LEEWSPRRRSPQERAADAEAAGAAGVGQQWGAFYSAVDGVERELDGRTLAGWPASGGGDETLASSAVAAAAAVASGSSHGRAWERCVAECAAIEAAVALQANATPTEPTNDPALRLLSGEPGISIVYAVRFD
jgi:hypothetical protein